MFWYQKFAGIETSDTRILHLTIQYYNPDLDEFKKKSLTIDHGQHNQVSFLLLDKKSSKSDTRILHLTIQYYPDLDELKKKSLTIEHGQRNQVSFLLFDKKSSKNIASQESSELSSERADSASNSQTLLCPFIKAK